MFELNEGENFYVAINVGPHSDLTELRKLLSGIPDQITTKAFRFVVMTFTSRIEEIRIYHPSTKRDVIRFTLDSLEWSDAKPSIDSVVNFVMGDHQSVGQNRPKVFVHSDGPVITHWSQGLLSQVIEFVWLKEQGLDMGRKHE